MMTPGHQVFCEKEWLSHSNYTDTGFVTTWYISKPGPQQLGWFGLENASWARLKKHSEKVVFLFH